MERKWFYDLQKIVKNKMDALGYTARVCLRQEITAAGMTSGGLRVQIYQNTIQNERSK